jgi:AmmeMemoRadiSam system protein B
MRSDIRPPAVAGLFYPGDAAELRRMVEGFLDSVVPDSAAPLPKAVVAPHAGYPYSGPVAASAYAQVARCAAQVRRVVLLGPAHRYPVYGLALPGASALATPLGQVPVDGERCAAAEALDPVFVQPRAHDGEHCLEVQLPFLQVVLGDFAVVPLVVGDPEPEHVVEVLEALWGGPETLVVVSSDLSHYLRYREARELDERTARSVEALDADAIGPDQACGRVPLGGLLRVARAKGLQARTLDLRSSGDTAGDRHRVVGYGAWAFAA